MLRRVLAPALLVLGVTAIALAVASATVWRPADHLTASATGATGTAALVTEPGVLHAADPEVALEAVSASGAELVLVYAPTVDVEAWLGQDPVTRVTGLDRVEGVVVLTTTTIGTGTEPTPDPAGADLWWWELSGSRIATDLDREPGRLSVMVYSPAGAEDVTLTLSWPQEVSTPWVVPGVVLGSVLVLLALVLLVLRIRRDRAERAHRAAVEATAELAAVAGAPLTRRQLRELEASGVVPSPGPPETRPDDVASGSRATSRRSRAASRAETEARAEEPTERERTVDSDASPAVALDEPATAAADGPAAVATHTPATVPAGEPPVAPAGEPLPTSPDVPTTDDPDAPGAAVPAVPARPMSRRELRLAAQRAAQAAAAPEDVPTPGAGSKDGSTPEAAPQTVSTTDLASAPGVGPTRADDPAGDDPTPAAPARPDPTPARPFPATWAAPAGRRAEVGPGAAGPGDAAPGSHRAPAVATDPVDRDGVGQDADPALAATDGAAAGGVGQERRGWRRLFGRKGRPAAEPEPVVEPEPDVAWLPDPPAPPSVSADAWRRAWGFPDTPTEQPTGEEER